MSRYARWARREHSEATRIGTTLLAGPVFLGLLPLLRSTIVDRSPLLPQEGFFSFLQKTLLQVLEALILQQVRTVTHKG